MTLQEGSVSEGDESPLQVGWTMERAQGGYVARMKHNPDKRDCMDAVMLADLERVGYLPKVAWPRTRFASFAGKLLDRGEPKCVAVAATNNRWMPRRFHQMPPEKPAAQWTKPRARKEHSASPWSRACEDEFVRLLGFVVYRGTRLSNGAVLPASKAPA